MLTFVWDRKKATQNLKKHEISFEDASTVFDDPFEVTVYDVDHSFDEYRFVTLGQVANGRVVVVCYKEERTDLYRIITARAATATERRDYEQGEI
jgi:uncharacterized DUF497 family protein